MKVIGLMIFYDESPTWLAATVASMSKCCDHLVAVDGAYFLYPQGKPNSGPDQASEIISTALALNMGVTYHAPDMVWMENEVGKRNYMLQLGLTMAEPGEDWFVIVDADELVTNVPSDFRDVLANAETDCATYQLYERTDWHASEAQEQAARNIDIPPGWTPIRGILRALPTLHVHQAHYTYATRDENGQPNFIWSRDSTSPAVDTDLKIEHRRAFRTKHRLDSAESYYELRDRLGVEREPLPI